MATKVIEDVERGIGMVRALPPLTDMSDAWDLAKQPIPQLFKECMPRGEFCLLASEPGVGKSTLALGLGLSVGLSKPMVAGFTPSRPGRALILAGEDHKHPVCKRMVDWCERREVSRTQFQAAVADGRLSFICGDSAAFLVSEYGALHETSAFQEMKEICATNRYDLVIVDSLIQWAGVSNENDNAQMDLAGSAMVRLAKACGGVVLGVCHTNKQSNRTGEVGLHAIRGGSALAGKIRWGAQLLKLSEKELRTYGIRDVDRWRYLRYEEIKNQYARQHGAPIYFERGEGGILDPVRLSNRPRVVILPHLVTELRSVPVALSRRQLYKNEGPEAKDLRARVEKRAKIEHISNDTMQAAIQAGIELNQLQEVDHPTKKTKILAVV